MELTIIKDIPQMQAMQGHPQPVPMFLTPKMIPGLDLDIAAVEIASHVGEPIAAPHVHDATEIYLAICPNRGDVVFEVICEENNRFTVDGPAAVVVPAGMTHQFCPLYVRYAPCFFFGVFLRPAHPDAESPAKN